MANDESFVSRWSQRKRDAERAAAEPKPAPAAPAAETKPAELPSPETLSFESDFKAFMQAKVDQGVRRAALKKLFSDPRFNVMDGLDVYIDDYTKGEPIPPEMLARLEHAKRTLFGPEAAQGEAESAASGKEPAAGAQATSEPVRRDEAPRQGQDEEQTRDGAAGQDPQAV